MRIVQWVGAGVLVGVFGLALIGAEKPSEEHVKAMKDLAALNLALGKPGASEDMAAATKFSATALASLRVTEKYWETKGVDDALKIARSAIKSAQDLNVAANLSSPEGVAAAAKELATSCAACHTPHRERLPDGTFQIK